MDTLGQVVATAAPLLRRIDDLLSGVGAPADHDAVADHHLQGIHRAARGQGLAGERPPPDLQGSPEACLTWGGHWSQELPIVTAAGHGDGAAFGQPVSECDAVTSCTPRRLTKHSTLPRHVCRRAERGLGRSVDEGRHER